MVVFLQRQTTFSLVTTWTEVNSPWKPSASCWLTRSNTQRTFSCSGATTSVLPSTVSTDSTMSVSRYQLFIHTHTHTHIYSKCNNVCLCHPPGKRRFNIKLWKTFTDCFNCLPIAAIIDEKIFCCHGGETAAVNNTSSPCPQCHVLVQNNTIKTRQLTIKRSAII